MKKVFVFLFVSILLVSCNNQSNENSSQNISNSEVEAKDTRKMAYQNGENIGIYDFSTGATKDLVKGYDPCISPDGEWLAYTESIKKGSDYKRVVSLISVENSERKSLDIKDDNHYGAIWSPDGEFLVFSIMKKNWQLGLIKPDKSGFRILQVADDIGLYSPTWSHDGKHLFAHNLSVLFKMNINGDVVEKYDLKKMFGEEFFFSSATRFFMLSDNLTFVFEAEIDETMDGLNGPLSAVFSYNLNSKKVQRLTEKGFCSSGLWIDKQDRIYFSGFKNINESPSVFQTDLQNQKIIKIIDKANRPSIGIR
jgi:TolB protein